MNSQERILISNAIFAFASTIVIYDYFISSLVSISNNNNIIELFIALFSATSVFTLIFLITIYFYNLLITNIIYPGFYLAGDWYHITIIEEPEEDIRYGPIQIKNSLDSIKLSGHNFKFPSKYRSRLISEMARFDGDELLIQFESKGASREDNKTRNGFMSLAIIGDEKNYRTPTKLSGTWSDNLPSKYCGSVTIYKKQRKIERDKELCEKLLDFYSNEITNEEKKRICMEVNNGGNLENILEMINEAKCNFNK